MVGSAHCPLTALLPASCIMTETATLVVNSGKVEVAHRLRDRKYHPCVRLRRPHRLSVLHIAHTVLVNVLSHRKMYMKEGSYQRYEATPPPIVCARIEWRLGPTAFAHTVRTDTCSSPDRDRHATPPHTATRSSTPNFDHLRLHSAPSLVAPYVPACASIHRVPHTMMSLADGPLCMAP